MTRIEEILESLQGCGDSSCLVKKPTGMATNGGCRCFTDFPTETRQKAHKLAVLVNLLREEQLRLTKELTDDRASHPGYHHCHCMFYRENEGKKLIAYSGVGYEESFTQLPVGFCGQCDGTGWCT
jgi:hypothetical protein